MSTYDSGTHVGAVEASFEGTLPAGPPGGNFVPLSSPLDDDPTVYVCPDKKIADHVRGAELDVVVPFAASSTTPYDWLKLKSRPVIILGEIGAAGIEFAHRVVRELLRQDPDANYRFVLPGERGGSIEQWFQQRAQLAPAQIRVDLAGLPSRPLPNDVGPADDPDDPDDQITASEVAAGRSSRRPKEPTQAELLLELAKPATLFHTSENKTYATVRTNNTGGEKKGRIEHLELRGSGFKDWLTHQFFRERRTAPTKDALDTTIRGLEANARYDGPTEQLYLRVASFTETAGQAYYLDLADKEGRAVKITSEGWEVTDNPPVKFRRPRKMKSLPVPEREGSLASLREFVNVGSERDWMLFLGALVAYLRPMGPYPLLVIQGEQGSAKSTTTEIVSRLIDPISFSRGPARNEHDLSIAANNAWVVTMDNLSGLSAGLSDALCRLSTGGGFATRKLYSDDEETVFDAMRPIVLNGIDDIAERPDLLDRSIVLNLPRLTGEARLTKQEFDEGFEAASGQILGALLDALAGGLKKLPEVTANRLPRMADFARFGEAVFQGLGHEPGAFLEAFEATQNSANVTALESCPVAAGVLQLSATESNWTGTATELWTRLYQMADEQTLRNKDWPKAPNKLSNKLKRAAPALRKEGVEIKFSTSGSRRSIEICRDSPSDGSNQSSGSSGSSAKESQSAPSKNLGQWGATAQEPSTPLPRRPRAASSGYGAYPRSSSAIDSSAPLFNPPPENQLRTDGASVVDGPDDPDDQFRTLTDSQASAVKTTTEDDDCPF